MAIKPSDINTALTISIQEILTTIEYTIDTEIKKPFNGKFAKIPASMFSMKTYNLDDSYGKELFEKYSNNGWEFKYFDEDSNPFTTPKGYYLMSVK